jgi:hypothetical protein
METQLKQLSLLSKVLQKNPQPLFQILVPGEVGVEQLEVQRQLPLLVWA